jgi:hypothetical protein
MIIVPSNVAAKSGIEIVGATAENNDSEVITPPFEVGDLVLVYAGHDSYPTGVNADTPPNDFGAPYQEIVRTASNNLARLNYFVATQSSSGTTPRDWGDARRVMTFVLRGHSVSSPIGASSAVRGTGGNAGVTAPALTLQDSSGSSLVLHLAHGVGGQSLSSFTTTFSTSGYTGVLVPTSASSGGTSSYRAVARPNASDAPAINLGNLSASQQWAALSVEIRA